MTSLPALTRALRNGRGALSSSIDGLRGRLSGQASGNGADLPEAPLVGPSELRQRRDRLARQLAELQWDLGGLAYEMAIRDHFRVDVLMRVAAQLQPVDVELGEIERLLRLEEAAAAGACPSCGALHARGVGFCWRCGTALVSESGSASAARGGA